MQAKYCVRSNCHETQQQRDETCIFSRRCEKCGLGELAFGVESCPDPAERALRAASLRQIESRPTLAITRHSAAAFGVLAAAVKQAGRSPRPRYNDLWIAAQTIEHGYALLTLNTADFSGLPGLRLLTLRGLGK